MTRQLRAFQIAAVALVACDRAPESRQASSAQVSAEPPAEPPDEPSPTFRNVANPTAYVGDASCASCHARLEITTSGTSVASVRVLDPPLASLPVRDRGPRAVQLRVASGAEGAGIAFVIVPSRGMVQIMEPDGTLVRALPTGDGFTVRWDGRTDAGGPITGGVYRARVTGRDPSGRPAAPQQFFFGVVGKRVR